MEGLALPREVVFVNVRRVWIGYCLLFVSLIWMASCGSSPETVPTSDPSPTPAPTLSPQQVIERAGARMLALGTARFVLEHEGDNSSQLFPGVQVNLVTGEVDMPDKFKVQIEAVSSFPRSFFRVDVVGVGNKAFMTDFIDNDKWNHWPIESLPFNFSDLGRTLNDIILSLQNPTLAGVEETGDVPTWRIKGTILSEDLNTLVPSAGTGHEIGLELWIGQPDELLRKVRIDGRVLDTDNPDMVRVLTIHGFDEPVEIVLPDVTAQ